MCRKEAAGAPVRVEEKLTEEVMKMKIYLLQNQEDSMNEPTDVGIVIHCHQQSWGSAAICWDCSMPLI